MAKKLKFYFDTETVPLYGLNGPGFLKDKQIRQSLKKFIEENSGFLEEESKSFDLQFINGEIKHVLWGKQEWETGGRTNGFIKDGEHYWLMEHEGSEWVKTVVEERFGVLFFVFEGGHSILPSIVWDYGLVGHQYSLDGQELPN